MTKKWIAVVVMFVFFASTVCALTGTSGNIWFRIEYVGKNLGQQEADRFANSVKAKGVRLVTNTNLTDNHWKCVREALNLYNTSAGDTFVIFFDTSYFVVCEFTDNTRYSYWAMSTPGEHTTNLWK